jgi:predicted DNA binding CopG/RHH family protein
MNTTNFPYEKFTIRLEHNEGKSQKLCWFECDEHLQKYLTRHKLKKKDANITKK